MTTATKVNLLNYDRAALTAFCQTLGEPAYRANQLLQWLHFQGVATFAEMTNLSKVLRSKLAEVACIEIPEIAYHQYATDGTQKWLLRLFDGNCIETVFIPEEDRGTLCISSQVGCALNCSFCSTAKQGFSRNLTTAEIIGQVWLAVRHLSKTRPVHDHTVTNVVLMGMGEPLLNLEAVLPALNIMLDDFGYGLSKRRVTLSTSGVVPMMQELAKVSDVALAVSLHAPNDTLRNQLVPLNKKYPLAELIAVCRDFFPAGSRRVVTMEYVMLAGVNDSPQHAKELIRLLQNVPAKVNLIPFNPFPQTSYQCSSLAVINQFRDQLMAAGINTITRKTRGDDIDAACGQLVGQFKDKTKRRARYKALAIPVVLAQSEVSKQTEIGTRE